jgi:hypothetical protein
MAIPTLLLSGIVFMGMLIAGGMLKASYESPRHKPKGGHRKTARKRTKNIKYRV